MENRAMSEGGVNKLPWRKDIKKNWQVYAIFSPAFIMTLVLSYIPMFGIIMAFENYNVNKGYFGSKWVGFDNFIELFTAREFLTALRNTVGISMLKITVGFVMPILFAFLLSALRSKKFKRLVQTMSYLPNFVAAVVVASLVREFLMKDGPITLLLSNLFGAENQNWLANNELPVFWIIYLMMGIWQGVGWGSIIYMAAISGVSSDLYESAAIDGATKLQRLLKITLPCIMPTIVMMFVLNVGTSFIAGFDGILLLYMPSTYEVADTLYTFTYRKAFTSGANYGLAAASGLFQSIVGTTLLVGSNYISKKVSDTSLF